MKHAKQPQISVADAEFEDKCDTLCNEALSKLNELSDLYKSKNDKRMYQVNRAIHILFDL